MGLLDKLGIGGTKDEREARTAAKLQKKATEKYGPPENRQGAIEELGEMRTPRAIEALLMRYTVRVEPGKTGRVTVQLETPRQPGEFKGAVVVNFRNEGIRPLAFWTTGELVPPIELDPMPAFFVSTQRGEDKTTWVEIKNHQPDPLDIFNVIHNSSRFTTRLEVLEEGQHYRLSLTLKGDGPAGRQTEPITLVTSSRERPFLELQAHTNINERVYTFPPALDFETVKTSN